MKYIVYAVSSLMIVSSLPVAALADTVYVNADNVNVRSGPSLDAKIKGTLDYGFILERESSSDGWSKVTVNGEKAYISSQYLAKDVHGKESIDQSQKESPGSKGVSNSAAESPYVLSSREISLDTSAPYASFAKITDGKAIYYQNSNKDRKNLTVCVNAGHGTKGGSSVKTLCHPDGTPKVTGGTTAAGATEAVAVSSGMTFADGTPEYKVTLKMALILRDRLLEAGYDVLMIREGDDVQLDNVARTVIANTEADCHIALHWDSTESDKGCFYMSVPSAASYRSMEPVASHWQQHNQLGECLIAGLRDSGSKIFSSGSMEMDLTQISYSTIPSVDIELGDKVSSHTDETLEKLADGLLNGIEGYFAAQQ